MKPSRLILLTNALLLTALLCVGCGKKSEISQDARTGVVSKDYQIDARSLVPDSVRLDSDYDNFLFSDHLVFLGEKDAKRYALSLTFNRALADNRFRRAERDFLGFFFNGHDWENLPYTRMKHDSLRLDLNSPYIFGGLSFSDSRTSGNVHYDRHDLRFDLHFDNLQPVQLTEGGVALRHCHAIGTGTLSLSNDTIVGQVYYELIQLEGSSPFVDTRKLSYGNYRWLALTSASGYRFLAAGDSSTSGEAVLKSFVSVLSAESLRYADGSDNVHVSSLGADSRSVLEAESPGIGVKAGFTGTGRRICQQGLCVTLVDAHLSVDGATSVAWGIVEEHQQ